MLVRNLGKIGEYKLNLREYKLNLSFLRRSKFYYYFGQIFLKKWYFFREIFLFPSKCPTKKMQYGRLGSVRGSIPPRSSLLVVFEHVSPAWIWRARNSPQFWHFNLEPLFWDFYPEPNFSKNLSQFWNFLRIQTLGIFVLHFHFFEFTACDCRSLEFTIGPTNILSLLVVGTNIFLIPLALHWKKAADIVSPS